MYKISRPPLLKTYELPPREKLLRLKNGDNVKLVFTDENGENAERMWVKITDKIDGDSWEGTLDNVPVGLNMKLDQKIIFHPLDIIDFLLKKQKVA